MAPYRTEEGNNPGPEKQSQEVWLAQAFSNEIGVGIFVLDADFRVVWMNTAQERFFGLRKEEVLGQDKRMLIESRIKNIFENPELFVARVLATYRDNNYAERFECHVLPGDGRGDCWLEHRSEPIRSGPYAGGRIEQYFDITERKRAEQAIQELNQELEQRVIDRTAELRESELRFRSQYDNLPLPTYTWRFVGRDFVFLNCNRAALAVSNGRVSALMGRAARELHADRPDIVEDMARCYAQKSAFSREMDYRYRSIDKMGRIKASYVYVPPDLVMVHSEDITERKRAEEALRRSEEKFAKAFLCCPDVVTISTVAEGRFVDCNSAAEQITGYQRQEMIGKTAVDLGIWASPQDRRRMVALLGEQARIRNLECDFRMKSGEVRRGSISAELIELDSDRFILGVVQDITERKRAEEELRASEERYRWLVENSPSLICSHDLDGTVLSVNAAGGAALGYQAEELIGKHLRQFLSPSVQDKVEDYLAQVRTSPVVSGIMRVRTKDGEERFWLYRNTLCREPGRPAYVLGNGIDITERMRAERRLKQETARLNALMDHNPLAIAVLDDNHCVQLVNPAFERLFLYSREEMVGTVLDDMIGTAEQKADMARLTERVLSGESVRIEEKRRRKDGMLVDVEIQGVPLEVGGEPAGVYVLYNDISGRKQAEEELRARARQQAAVAEFGQYAIASKHVPALMDKAVELVAQTLGVEYSKLLECLPNAQALVLRAGVGWRPGLVGRATVGAGENSQAGFTLLCEAPVVVEDLRRESRFQGPALLLEHGVVSGLSVAIRSQRETFGVLGVHTRARRDFTADDIHFLEAVANLLGLALERNRVEEAMRSSELRYRNLFEDSPVSLWLEDFSEVKAYIDRLREAGVSDFRNYFEANPEEVQHCVELVRVIDVNRATLRQFKVSGKDVLLGGIGLVFVDPTYDIFREELLTVCGQGTTYAGETKVRTPAGEVGDYYLRWQVAPGYEENYTRVLVSLVDITERKQAEERLKGSYQQLRDLAVHLQSIREDERTAVAREMHDELGQAMTGLKMDLAWLARRLRKDQQSLRERVRDSLELVDSTIATVREISARLRPGILDDLGLVPALEWQAEEFQARTGIHCQTLISTEPLALPASVSTAVFRVFQETLTNIARHARATRVCIRLEEREDALVLQVVDDGRGIANGQAHDSRSLGLLGMRERAYAVGGALTITGAPGKGTTVHLSVPRVRDDRERKR